MGQRIREKRKKNTDKKNRIHKKMTAMIVAVKDTVIDYWRKEKTQQR